MTMYPTKDFTLACTLLSLGHQLDSSSKDIKGEVFFQFLRDEFLDAHLEAFWRGEIRIEPKTYHHTQRYLRNLIRREE